MAILSGMFLFSGALCAGLFVSMKVQKRMQISARKRTIAQLAHVSQTKGALPQNKVLSTYKKTGFLINLLATFLTMTSKVPCPTSIVKVLARYGSRWAENYVLCLDKDSISRAFAGQLFVAMCTSALGILVFGPAGSLAGAIIAIGPYVVIASELKKQQKLLREQLIELVEEISDALKAGKSLGQSLGQAAKHTDEPMRSLLNKAVRLMACGVQADRAFSQAIEAGAFEEARTLAAALQIQYRTGGNLNVLLAEFASQFRQDLLFEQNLKTQTAQGRLSVKVVAVLPPLLVVVMNFISPGYLNSFMGSNMGRSLFVLALVLDALGLFMVKKIMSVSVV